MFDESRYRAGPGGGAHQPGWAAPQPPRVPLRPGDDHPVATEQVFVVGANSSTLAITSALKAGERGEIGARLVPLAWTPRGVFLGEAASDVTIPLDGLYDWIDRTFPPQDAHAFVASIRDLELLVRIGWESSAPERVDERTVVNIEDLPEEIAEAFAQPPVAVVACSVCRRLCVRAEFAWKEKDLCAWDYHAAVFGRRGPWREATYEPQHLETIPSCAYVVPELLAELEVEALLTVARSVESAAHGLVNAAIESSPARAHIVVRTPAGLTVLRER